MPCPRCGQPLAVGAASCAGCGNPLAAPNGAMPPGVPARTSGMAIAGFVLSFFCGLLGLVFSILGRNECKRSNGSVGGAGLALAGIIISILQLVAAALYAIAIAYFVHAGVEEINAQRARAAQAQQVATQARADAASAAARLAQVREELDIAQRALDRALDQDERDEANARLSSLRQQEAATQKRVDDTARAAARAQREQGVTVNPDCIANPLAKGC